MRNRERVSGSGRKKKVVELKNLERHKARNKWKKGRSLIGREEGRSIGRIKFKTHKQTTQILDSAKSFLVVGHV